MPQQVIKFNQAQRDVLNVVSLLKSDEDVKALRKVLIDSGEWSEEKLQQMSKENLRTHYEEP